MQENWKKVDNTVGKSQGEYLPTSQEYSEEQSRRPVGASSDAESGEGRINPALEVVGNLLKSSMKWGLKKVRK